MTTELWHQENRLPSKGARGLPHSQPHEVHSSRRDKAFIAQLCLRSVNRLFDLSGGHALFDSVALQRFQRDAHAVAHRDGLIMDLGGQQYGKVVLGP